MHVCIHTYVIHNTYMQHARTHTHTHTHLLHFAHQACIQAILAHSPYMLPLSQEDRPLEKYMEDLGMERG